MLDQSSFDSDVALDRSVFAGGATTLDDSAEEDHGAQARSRALVDQAAGDAQVPDPTRAKPDATLAGADAAAIEGRLTAQGYASLGGGHGDVLFVTAIGAGDLGSTLAGGVAPNSDYVASQKVARGVGIATPSLGLQKSQDPTNRYLIYGRIPADQVKYATEVTGGGLSNPGFAAGSVEQGIALANVSMVIDTQSEVFQKVRRGMILEQWLAEVAAAATASKGTPRSELAIVNNERAKNMTNADYLASYVEWKRLVQGEEISTAEALAEIERRINANFDSRGLAVTNRGPLWSDAVLERGKTETDAIPKPAPAPTSTRPAAEPPKPAHPPVASKLRQILEVVPGILRVTFDTVIDTVARQFRPHPGEADGALPEVVSSREAGGEQTMTPGHGAGRFTVEQLADESTRLLLKLKLAPEAGVSAEELTKIKQQAVDGMNRYWDLQFTVTGNDGIPRPLRFAVDFVETGWHYEVAVKSGSGRDNSMTWFENSGAQVRAHEMGHLLGLPDEYFAPMFDSSYKDWPERSAMGSEWVKYDQSIMGHGSAPRERHGDMIASVMSTRDESFDAAMASQVAMPKLPTGRTALELGEAIGWGKTTADAIARAASITRAELDAAGFTTASALEWLAFFRDAALRHPQSASAGRAKLMERSAKLLRGDD